MVFDGTTGVYRRFQMSKKEREMCEYDRDLKNFRLGSNLIVT